MPQRNIEKEVRDTKTRESEIARELRIAREDFSEAVQQYNSLVREFKRLDSIHLKKVRRNEKESELEEARYKSTRDNLEKTRKILDEKEKLLHVAQSAEYNYRKHQYEMTKYVKKNPVSRFFSWVASIPSRIAERISDTFILSAEVKRLAKLPDSERQEEIRKMRESYALDQAERKMERAATTQAKEFILDHPEAGIRNFHEMDVRQQDMIVMEKMISLSSRTGQTLYLGLGRDNLLKIEMMDDEINRDSGYVSVRLMSAGRDENGNAFLKEGKEIGHVHVQKQGGIWVVDMQNSSKVQMEAALSAGRAELSAIEGRPTSGLRRLDRVESEIVAEATMDDAARKREALNREMDKGTKGREPASPEEKDAPEKGGKEPETPEADRHMGRDAADSHDDSEPEMPENDEVSSGRKGSREQNRDSDRKKTEKNIEKTISELHDAYKRDKTPEEERAKTVITVDRYQVSINPPDSKHDTAYYKVDNRYAGKYMKSNSNPRITMDYIRRHNVLDNPVNTISTDKLDDHQLAGNIARGLLHDAIHRTTEVPAFLDGLSVSGREYDQAEVSRYIVNDLKDYPEQERSQIMSDVYGKIQAYDMDDSLRDSKASAAYLEGYKSYMLKNESGHDGQFQRSEVDYVAKDGTLFDRDGKLFLDNDGKAITLENCIEHCPEEEKETIQKDLKEMRASDLGKMEETVDRPEPEMNDASHSKEMDDEEHPNEYVPDIDDWLAGGDSRDNDLSGFSVGDEQSIPLEDYDSNGPDFGLQAEMDLDGYGMPDENEH